MENNAPKSILETVLANAHAKAIPVELAPEAPAPKTPEPKKPEAKPPIAKPATPDHAAELAKAQARIAELEGSLSGKEKELSDLAKLKNAAELWKSKKRIEAIEVLSGAQNIDDELDAFVADYVKAPSKETKSAVEEKLDEILARDKKREDDAAKAKEDEEKRKAEEKKEADAKAKKATEDYAGSVLEKNKEKFELCAREKNKQEVCEKAPIIALEVLRAKGIKVDERLTAEQAESAMVEALAEIEKDLEQEGIERFLKKSKPAEIVIGTKEEKKEPAPPRVAPPEIKVSVSPKPGSIGDVIANAKKRAIYQ